MQQNKQRQETKPVINVVTQVEADTTESNNRPAKQKIINLATIETGMHTEDSQASTAATALSYLDIYQQLQAAKACSPFYQFWRRSGLEADLTALVRPPVKLYGQADYLPGEQAPLTTGQTETLVYWVKRCHGLWSDYGVFNAADNNTIPINDITDTLSKKLLTTVPQSKKAMAIKKTRQLATQWQQSFAQLEATLAGEDSSHLSDLQLIHDEIEQLKQLREELRLQWLEARDSDESLAQSLKQQRIDLLQQIDQYENEINDQKVVNQEALQQVVADFERHDQSLNQSLYTDVAEVFYEALITFEGDSLYGFNHFGFAYHSDSTQPANQYRITPDQLVFEVSGRHNRLQHSFVLRYTAQLFLCDLGFDCAARSPIMMHYCLFGMQAYPAACGKNLKVFFQHDLISPNRLQDVLLFKKYYQDLFDE